MILNKKINWKGDKVSVAVRMEMAKTLDNVSEALLTEANKTVPHDIGDLEKSGDTDIDRTKLIAHVFYDTPYARRLHEHPEYNFNKGRRGKWLELTVIEWRDRFKQYIRDSLSHILN